MKIVLAVLAVLSIGSLAHAGDSVSNVNGGTIVLTISDQDTASAINDNLSEAPIVVNYASGPGLGKVQNFSSASVVCNAEGNGTKSCSVFLKP